MSVNTKSQALYPSEHPNTCYLNHCVLLTVTKQRLQNNKFNHFITCTMHHLLFCTMTNQCTVNWQSIIIYQLIVPWLVIVENEK